MQILTGEGKAPSDERTLAMGTALVGEAAPPAEIAATAAAVDSALRLRHASTTCKVRTVKRKGRTLRAGAEPGPSGWRNSHLQAMLRRAGGPEAVATWCRQWTAGTTLP